MLDIYVAIFFSFFYFESILLCSRLELAYAINYTPTLNKSNNKKKTTQHSK